MEEKFYSDWQNNNRSTKKTRAEIATESAQNIHKSLYGETIVEKNPLENKQLQAKLNKLEQQKKAFEQEYFWAQRQFFIKRAFTENNELKFVKLNGHAMKDENELKLPLIFSAKSAPSMNTSMSSPFKFQRSLTQNIFPVNPSLNLPSVSSNYKLLQETEQKHKFALDRMQTALNLTDDNKWQSAKNFSDDKKSRSNSIKENPLLMPIEMGIGKAKERKGSKNKNALNKRNSVIRKGKNKQQNELKFPDIHGKENELRSSTHYIESRGYVSDSDEEIIAEALKKVEHLNMENGDRKNKIKDSDLVKNKNNFVDVLRRTSNSLEVSISENDNDVKNLTIKSQTSSLIMDNSVSRTLKSDELLVKLTKSLPMHLLIKTDETLTDLSTVLGYVDRNKTFAAKEKSIASKSCVFDDRFQNLLSALKSKGEDQNAEI